MRSFIKSLGILILLSAYLFTACVSILLPAGGRLRRTFQINTVGFFSRILLAMLGISIHVKHGERMRDHSRGILIAANHVSYVDILVLASLTPSIFITSIELRNTPGFGLLARLGGSLFVERRKAAGLKQEIAMIAGMLGAGFAVAFFPEGTTSNGERVQPFKRSLFDAAVRSGADILPVCLRYRQVNGGPLTPEKRDAVYLFGGTTILQHFPRLLSLRSVDVEVLPLKLIKVQGPHTRKELASRAHAAIHEAYQS